MFGYEHYYAHSKTKSYIGTDTRSMVCYMTTFTAISHRFALRSAWETLATCTVQIQNVKAKRNAIVVDHSKISSFLPTPTYLLAMEHFPAIMHFIFDNAEQILVIR